MLPHVDQLDKKLTNAMNNSEKSETLVTNEIWNGNPEKDSNSTIHFLLMPSHTGRTLGIVGNSGDGGGLEAWRRSACKLDPQASSTVDSAMRELHALDCLSDNKSHELLDKECLQVDQVTSVHLKRGTCRKTYGGNSPPGVRAGWTCWQKTETRPRASTEPEWQQAMQCPCSSVP